jgi:hypothetical protein
MSIGLNVKVVEMTSCKSMVWVFPVNTGSWSNSTWAWELIPVDNASTRLITRLRVDTDDDTALTFMETCEIFMMRKCMLGIKQRVESH